MNFHFSNLGYIENGNIDLADLTIIFGENNVGKTYLSYTIYGLIKNLRNNLNFNDFLSNKIDLLINDGSLVIDLNELINEIPKALSKYSKRFSSNLDDYFNVNEGFFEYSKIEMNLKDFDWEEVTDDEYEHIAYLGGEETEILIFKEKSSNELNISIKGENLTDKLPKNFVIHIVNTSIRNFLFKGSFFRDPFVITSERTGISLFYKELDISKNLLLETLMDSKELNPRDIINSRHSRYARPIHDNISVIRDYENISKKKSFIQENKRQFKPLLNNLSSLIGGSFKSSEKSVLYYPKKGKDENKAIIPFYVTSSSIKSLFLVDLYVNCLAKKGGLLIIDEPELNLHPNKQRQIAKLLIQLVNAGIKILITTHSDYLVREINNRIMLNNIPTKDSGKIMKEFKIDDSELLNIQQVRAFGIDDERKITSYTVDEYGIDTRIFDKVINEANILNDKIFYSLDAEK